MFFIPLIVAGSIAAAMGGTIGGNYLFNVERCGEARCYASPAGTEPTVTGRYLEKPQPRKCAIWDPGYSVTVVRQPHCATWEPTP